ncbi:MAG: hypothetical protein GDA51_06200 [Ekhidna sp.]|nr:hypothetical protein [Ekhidna sp.]MBC6426050.1 hypothetical protein [Ekhidna sp.]
MRKLDKEVGKETSEAIIRLMDLKAQTFEQKLDMLYAQNNNIKTLIAIVGLVSVLASIAGQFIN